MASFSVEHVWNDFYNLHHDGRRIAVITPARPAQTWPRDPALPWSIIILMEAFPDLPARNLPHPLHNGLMHFDTFEELLAFLGVEREAVAA